MNNDIIWIVGASSGIGRELAIALSKQGARLILSARRVEELDALNLFLGDKHLVLPIDITFPEQVLAAAHKIKITYGAIDRVIFMAATYTPTRLGKIDVTLTKRVIDVNLGGAFNLLAAILPIFIEQNRGQIALCASVAGYIGLPKGQPYSATKAAILNLAESLRAEMPESIDVKVINPGFVETPMTAKNSFKMPMIITSEKAAYEIIEGLKSRKFEIHFPKKFTFIIKLLNLLPYFILNKMIKKL